MSFTLCEYMIDSASKVRLVELTDANGKKAMRVSATVEGLLTIETDMVHSGTSIVGSDIVGNFELLADNSKHSGSALRCSKAARSSYLTMPLGGTLIAKITHAGGVLSVTVGGAGDCGA